MSNLSRLLNEFKKNFPTNLQPKVDIIEKFIINYINKSGIRVKFLNSCATGFAGVRTKNEVIICSPSNMQTIGDFLYTIFHEIRHEHQVADIKMKNPFIDFDLDDFENLYKQYWEMELDADQFAKNMVARIVMKLEIPLDFAKKQFSLSEYIKNYPNYSQNVKTQLTNIIRQIKEIKKTGGEFTDILDHPMIQKHISKLENFI